MRFSLSTDLTFQQVSTDTVTRDNIHNILTEDRIMRLANHLEETLSKSVKPLFKETLVQSVTPLSKVTLVQSVTPLSKVTLVQSVTSLSNKH